MNLEEAMAEHGLSLRSYDHRSRYADILESPTFDNNDLPEELKGVEISRNQKCEWFRKKNFINTYKHGITFQSISSYFDEDRPGGLFESPKHYAGGDDLQKAHYVDSRSWFIINTDHSYVLVVIDKSLTKSGLVHLISARKASTADVERAFQSYDKTGSTEAFDNIYSRVSSSKYDYYSELPKYVGEYDVLAKFFVNFMHGESPSETVSKIYSSSLGISKEQAEAIVWDWLHDRNVEYLLGLTDKTF